MVNSAINFDFIISFFVLKVFAVNNSSVLPYEYMNKQLSVGLTTLHVKHFVQRGGHNG